MAEYLIQGTTLTDIADAIRTKKKSSETINVSDFASQIETIETEEEVAAEIDFSDFETENKIVETFEDGTSKTSVIEYDENGMVSKVIEGGKEISYTFELDDEGYIKKISDSEGNETVIVGKLGGGSSDNNENVIEKWISGEAVADINLPNATAMRASLFKDDKILTSISMPKVKSIGDYAFQNCYNLVLTSLPKNLETIGSRSFSGCKNAFTSFPSSLKSIDARAFYYNAFIAITFKGTPTSIASDAFDGCSNLTTINVPWAEGAVANAPWGATSATINYNYTGE